MGTQLPMARSLISLVIAGMQLELRAMPPFFCAPLSLGLIDVALTLPSDLLFFNISRMASAWYKTGYALPNLLNRTHALICELKASSLFPPFFSTSSFTASVHSPHIHFPKNLARTFSMYSGVHSSHMPQHSHLAFSTSDIGGRFKSIPSWLSSYEMSDTVRLRLSDVDSLGGFEKLLFFLV